VRNRERYLEEIETATAELAKVREETKPFTTEFTRRGGWNRYFLVSNDNGHVHREMYCHTCYPTTRYNWLIDLADCDENAMIEEWGEKACTVCFKDAPSNPNYHRPARVDRETAAAREAEKAAKMAAKNAKAITAPDGTPLVVKTAWGKETYRTKVAARNALANAVASYVWYGGEEYIETEALTADGTYNPTEVIERAKKRAAKEGAEHTFPGI
jgi:hypothetical protein